MFTSYDRVAINAASGRYYFERVETKSPGII
jgi:hypothetical protein